MTKRAFIIHGWGGNPNEPLLHWIAEQLTELGFEVHAPQMPDTDYPTIKTWTTHLASVVGTPQSTDIFVGHSIGCQTILRYLETLPDQTRTQGVYMIAPWFTLTGLETTEEEATAQPWVDTPIDFAKVRQHTDTFFAVFSDNDPFVPLSNKETFEKELGAKTSIEHGKGHFIAGNGVVELPLVITKIKEFSL